ncbi:hypothetical protein, partial [Thiolapillus sp.]|uniref:hypothetical protein n=1 Tax=Thiolapillus sp. TaxID=2017437 RepID=UPI003AF47E53
LTFQAAGEQQPEQERDDKGKNIAWQNIPGHCAIPPLPAMDSSQENDDTAYRSASLFNSRSLLPFPVAPQRLNSRLTEND